MRRAIFALAVIAFGLVTPVARAMAQGSIVIDLPRDEPFPAAPSITVHLVDFPASAGLLRVRLRLSLNESFGLIVLDSVVAGNDARFITKRLLPENSDIFAEASALNFSGQSIATQFVRAGRTGRRLTLVNPNGRTAVTLTTQQPVFAWRSAPVTTLPGPWIYELFITNVARQETRSRPGIVDSVLAIPDTLQANTSYRWKVVARLLNGFPEDSAVASSESSFIISPRNAAVTTLLYQNFPNPFPASSSSTTCIWFDLERASHVQLTILDIRGNRIKTLVPGRELGSELSAGRYGRRDTDASGCDERLAWDGTADNGRVVPAGVYLVRLKTDTSPESVKKIVFLGR